MAWTSEETKSSGPTLRHQAETLNKALSRDMGGFEQLFPALNEEKNELFQRILSTAEDLFPSDGCVCSYCRRSSKVRRQAEAAQVIHIANQLRLRAG